MILSILTKLRQLKPGNDDEKMLEKRGSIQEIVTKEFQDFLENKAKEMYPDMLSTYYFVPPVYFNKIRYKTQSIGDEAVYVPDLLDPSEAKHDRAMQHVLYCLRHMAEQQQQMFVLTQFRYENYLSNPGNDNAKHRLPVPSGLKGADKRTKCFDLLIFHRNLGVMVAVVKPVVGEVTESPEDQQKLTSLVVTEVSDAIQQLKKADLMLKHLMSDREKLPTIRGTIILPNLAKPLLQRAIDSNVKLLENLRECLGATADDSPVDLCLCAEQLSSPNTPWDVSSDVVTNVQQWLEKLMRSTVDGESMWEELYVSMVARFCGPATKSTLQVPNGSAPFVLPKTLDETVSLTGQIIEGPIIYSDMADLMTSQKAFLSGPPNTGKTRMLSLVGRKWLSSGHDVFILNDASSKTDSFLSEHLQALSTPDAESSTKSVSGTVYIEVCDFKKKPSEIVGRINSKRGDKTPHVLLDDVQLDQKNFNTLMEALLNGLPEFISG
ncbi:uncharacterized protein LOC112575812 [Pomacea canaliculata]|uniref:uncharacterized protein LOC112575812 n=1 Tax=Pomacea canaliculata TaxID=400727 RepID=UPI000D72873C|nr:uncharacterized protein LOC112575812 [Pomacea canaliculata]XP_025113627.1 uncharacterized protein LOC112575812 [Pomacea canaliculata]